ncbi:MAG: Protease HtpX [Candidatus Accumulibacter phosphatis]|uniref:Protease HtpX n=1 Tax=Candidatus Accumulibacter phosphatis TaxID=327160 RepID=A0A080LTZ6_9PROT|nr:MAG: Protease HtpX [Candidatus Accumulibacter phosphatis]
MIAHEVAHIANGDMVTLTLIQGVVNTFVIFIARVVGWLVDSLLRRGGGEESGPGIGYTITVVVCDIVFGILASIIVMYFSRQREFRADAGAAQLMGSPRPMAAALRRLGGMEAGELPQNVATAGINGHPGWMALFSSHPPIEERIAVLESRS